MEPDDMFLKVEMTAYFSVNGLKIEKREFANDNDATGIYLNGKKIVPDMYYFLEATKNGHIELVDLPKSMKVELDKSSYKEEFVTRAQIWKEDPDAKFADEFLEKHLNEKDSGDQENS